MSEITIQTNIGKRLLYALDIFLFLAMGLSISYIGVVDFCPDISTHSAILVILAIGFFLISLRYGKYRTSEANSQIRSHRLICKIGKLQWDRNSFCRGWLITGATGVGKTIAGINLLMDQLFQNEKGVKNNNGHYEEYPWGGICIDEKGTYAHSITQMAKRYNRIDDLYVLETKPEGAQKTWKPTVRFNLLSEETVTASTYASAIVKTAEAVSGSCEEKGFFRTQAQTHILKAIELLRAIREAQLESGFSAEKCILLSLEKIHRVLCNERDFTKLLSEAGIPFNVNSRSNLHSFPNFINPPCQDLYEQDIAQEIAIEEARESSSPPFSSFASVTAVLSKPSHVKKASSSVLKSEKLAQCIEHFEKNYWAQPSDQLGGIQGTIHNYLAYFLSDDITEVFCKDSTFKLSDLDKGKVICIAMPHKLAIERRYICTFLKILFYSHVLSRFSNIGNKQSFEKMNLLVCWQDEAQRFIIEEDGDVDVIREAMATTVIACQSKTSLIPPLKNKDKANVTILNLRNRLIFRASDSECAQSSADFLGKKKFLKKSFSKGSGKTTYNYSDEVQHIVEPHELMKLPEFTAIVCHANSTFKKYTLKPLLPSGSTPHWWFKTLKNISFKKYWIQRIFQKRDAL